MQEFPTSGGGHTDRFFREALFLARMHHPALPSLYDYFYEDGYWYMVMDYIPGQTLTAYLRQQGPLPLLEALSYALQLCDVFDYLHRQTPPIVYRDLKPSNVLITPDGTLMLVDFGIARYFKEGQSNDTTDFGSPGYASPEQYQTEGQTDGRSDLYSLGVLLYEMVTGHRPTSANGGSPIDTMSKDALTLSPIISGLIALATRTEPMYRFQSAHTFFLALERAYAIEEHTTYQQRVMLQQAMGNQSDIAVAKTVETDAVAKGDVSHVNPLDPSQRQKIREVLQDMRRSRIPEEDLESELATFDEILDQRVSNELPKISLSAPTDVELPQPRPSPLPSSSPSKKQATHYSPNAILRASFLIALIACLLFVSLFVTARAIRNSSSTVQNPQSGATKRATPAPSSVATPTASTVSTAVWQPLPSLPDAQADNTSVYVQVKGRAYLYVNGGYRGAKASPHYDHVVYRYDIAAAQWETLSNAQFPGMVNNAVATDASGHVFYTAGYSTTTFSVTSMLYMYSPASDTVQRIVPPSTIALGFGSSTVADSQGHLYLTQGFLHSGNGQQAGTGWYRYDIETGQWHILAPLPIGLGYVVLAKSHHGIVLIGGAQDTGQQEQTNGVYTYNEAANTWTQFSSNAPLMLSGAASCIVQPGKLAIIGGYDATHGVGANSVWLVDLNTLKWTHGPTLPNGGSVFGSAASDGQGNIFLLRGASDPSKPAADVLQLTLS
jgi:serine/threonine protein kinase